MFLFRRFSASAWPYGWGDSNGRISADGVCRRWGASPTGYHGRSAAPGGACLLRGGRAAGGHCEVSPDEMVGCDKS